MKRILVGTLAALAFSASAAMPALATSVVPPGNPEKCIDLPSNISHNTVAHSPVIRDIGCP